MKRAPMPPRKKAMKRTAIATPRYRTLGIDEPDPPGDPLIYNATDGRVMQRWRLARGLFVERVLRDEDGTVVRWRPAQQRYRIDIAEAERRYRDGESLPVIAAALGCDTGNLSRLLRSAGVDMRSPTDYATTFDPSEAARRYKAGEGFRAIASSLGVSQQRVKAAVDAAGVRRRSQGRVKGRGAGGGRVLYQTEFDSVKPLVRARSGGRCEAQVAPRCAMRGEHVHHRRLRAQGGTNDIDNLLDVCVHCHSFIHANPAISYERGLLLHAQAPR